MPEIAIILLNEKGLETARTIQDNFENARIYGLRDRVQNCDETFVKFKDVLHKHFENGNTIIGLCASGILIRSLAPLLSDKRVEPPVLAVSDDGAIIIPLLGGLTGANELSRALADKLFGTPAITASGARHFNVQLEAPPEDYVLALSEAAKHITSDILAGKSVSLNGTGDWLETSDLPFTEAGEIQIQVSIYNEPITENKLLYHPKSVLIEIETRDANDADIETALKELNIARAAVAALIVPANGHVATAGQISRITDIPLRIIDAGTELKVLMRCQQNNLSVIELKNALQLKQIGRATGRLSVIGLGPGKKEWQTREVSKILENADALFGYKTYLDMVPVREGQQRFPSDNRVELDRARSALNHAAEGHHAVIVSSGDPGIFAMASAVMEAIDLSPKRWPYIELEVVPGLSAMQGAASLTGAPLGHDFMVISLSDIRKPMQLIKKRIKAAIDADLVIAIYNPASKTRREQIDQVIQLLRSEKSGETPVLIAKNVARENESLQIKNIANLDSDKIDMRTMLIIGSSKTKVIEGPNHRKLMYTPRTYEEVTSET